MPDKLLDLQNDIVFQELFGKQKNKHITQRLISLILEKPIYNIDLDVNKRMLGDRKNSKIGRLDIRAKFNDGEECNIELQVAPYESMEKRMLLYWASLYQNKINKGQEYDKLKLTISILIANYKIKKLEEIENFHTVWNLRERNNTNKIITNDIELHILEIPKIKEKDLVKNELAQWLKFIENPENEEVNKMLENNDFFKQAREELSYLSGDPDFQELVRSRAFFLMDQHSLNEQAKREGLKQGLEEGRERGIVEGKKEGKKEGIKEGIREGEKQEKVKMAKKLFKLKMPIEQIIELTELSKEELDKIKD